MITQMTISHGAGGGGRYDGLTTQMTTSRRAGEGGEVGVSCLLSKRQSAVALGEGGTGGGHDLSKQQASAMHGGGGRGGHLLSPAVTAISCGAQRKLGLIVS